MLSRPRRESVPGESVAPAGLAFDGLKDARPDTDMRDFLGGGNLAAPGS